MLHPSNPFFKSQSLVQPFLSFVHPFFHVQVELRYQELLDENPLIIYFHEENFYSFLIKLLPQSITKILKFFFIN